MGKPPEHHEVGLERDALKTGTPSAAGPMFVPQAAEAPLDRSGPRRCYVGKQTSRTSSSFRPTLMTLGLGAVVEQTLRERQERAARNQNLFREANERIEEMVGLEATFTGFACECTDVNCAATVHLTLKEYESVRRFPTHFAVKPGHVWSEVERVVETDGGDLSRYQVVEKFGEAGKLAVKLDPRSAAKVE